jgi:hypothetical protein
LRRRGEQAGCVAVLGGSCRVGGLQHDWLSDSAGRGLSKFPGAVSSGVIKGNKVINPTGGGCS